MFDIETTLLYIYTHTTPTSSLLFFQRASFICVRYLNFRAHVIVFIIIYQSIPILWFVLLYQKRKKLHQRKQTDVQLSLFVRDQDKDVDALRFLFNCYLPNRWWFEVAEIYRRTLFVGILPLLSPEASVRASVGMIFAIIRYIFIYLLCHMNIVFTTTLLCNDSNSTSQVFVKCVHLVCIHVNTHVNLYSIAFYREEQPFRVQFTNVIAYVAQYVIFMVYYCGLSLATGNVIDFGLK
jgi:hypothetical protein